MRTGKSKKPFRIYKFKTLSDNPEKSLIERETYLGRFLRKTSLDELPQLINILKGEMSFIGPRPLPIEYLPHYSKQQLLRFNVKPGITGLAQINGRCSLNWGQKFEFDVDYVKKKSMMLDIMIFIKTFKALISPEGNYDL